MPSKYQKKRGEEVWKIYDLTDLQSHDIHLQVSLLASATGKIVSIRKVTFKLIKISICA